MSHDQHTSRTGALGAAVENSPELRGVRDLEGQCIGAEAAEGARGSADVAEQRPGKLSYYTKRAIETEAEFAARDNRKPVEACSYPFGSPEAWHWMATYVLAGGAP